MPTVIRKARHDDARHRTRCTGSGAEAAAEAAEVAAADAAEAAEVRRPVSRSPPFQRPSPLPPVFPGSPSSLAPSPPDARRAPPLCFSPPPAFPSPPSLLPGGGGGRGGGQRWWDPEWREAKLAEMRAESDRGRVDVDADATRRALEAMLHDPERDELVIRDNVGRDGADAVERIARALGLYFRPYGRGTNTVLVASKVPLPNYRADLDGRRRAERDVAPVSADAADAVERWLARVEADANDADANDADANDASASRRPFEPHPSAAGPPPRTASLGGSSVGKKRLESGKRRDAFSALARCAATDALERERERRRVSTPSALRLDAARARLPAHAAKDAFLRALDGTQVLVVSGETGCGKTTQLPRFVLDRALAAGDASTTNVVCTQPRRVSAVSVAARVAHERGEALGDRVGYQIRLEARRSEATRLTFCTTGTLLRRLAEDSELRSVSHVFVDEIHERGMNEDFLLVVLRNLILERPDLKLILMSATLDAEKFAGYFDGAPTLHVPGFTYPVREMFLEEVLADASAKGAPIEIRTEGDTIRTGGSSALAASGAPLAGAAGAGGAGGRGGACTGTGPRRRRARKARRPRGHPRRTPRRRGRRRLSRGFFAGNRIASIRGSLSRTRVSRRSTPSFTGAFAPGASGARRTTASTSSSSATSCATSFDTARRRVRILRTLARPTRTRRARFWFF